MYVYYSYSLNVKIVHGGKKKKKGIKSISLWSSQDTAFPYTLIRKINLPFFSLSMKGNFYTVEGRSINHSFTWLWRGFESGVLALTGFCNRFFTALCKSVDSTISSSQFYGLLYKRVQWQKSDTVQCRLLTFNQPLFCSEWCCIRPKKFC